VELLPSTYKALGALQKKKLCMWGILPILRPVNAQVKDLFLIHTV
jgi:hypothetical protein